jgi:hypothetical protein
MLRGDYLYLFLFGKLAEELLVLELLSPAPLLLKYPAHIHPCLLLLLPHFPTFLRILLERCVLVLTYPLLMLFSLGPDMIRHFHFLALFLHSAA